MQSLIFIFNSVGKDSKTGELRLLYEGLVSTLNQLQTMELCNEHPKCYEIGPSDQHRRVGGPRNGWKMVVSAVSRHECCRSDFCFNFANSKSKMICPSMLYSRQDGDTLGRSEEMCVKISRSQRQCHQKAKKTSIRELDVGTKLLGICGTNTYMRTMMRRVDAFQRKIELLGQNRLESVLQSKGVHAKSTKR